LLQQPTVFGVKLHQPFQDALHLGDLVRLGHFRFLSPATPARIVLFLHIRDDPGLQEKRFAIVKFPP
jgi:hypothetical protein